MFWLIAVLIITSIAIALFIFPELGKFALNLGIRLLKWDGILLIVIAIFIVFFMYAKHQQMENKQMELQAVLKQEELKQESQANVQKPKDLMKETSQELQKQVTLNQEQPKATPNPKEIENIQNMLNNWLKSWEEGYIQTYRNFYASEFHSKGKNLDSWIAYKITVHNKSKNIKISIDELQITVNDTNATAVFIQHYSSSITKDSGRKTLELRKENNEWKIFREIM